MPNYSLYFLCLNFFVTYVTQHINNKFVKAIIKKEFQEFLIFSDCKGVDFKKKKIDCKGVFPCNVINIRLMLKKNKVSK